MSSRLEILIIGFMSFIIAGIIMRFANEYLDFWFGKKGGLLLWLLIALMISGLYHWLKQVSS